MARKAGDGKGRQGGGRKPGVPNKVTALGRELMLDFAAKKYKDFEEAFDKIPSPKDKCNVYLNLLAFAVPKLSSVDLKTDNVRKSFQEELDELAKKGVTTIVQPEKK